MTADRPEIGARLDHLCFRSPDPKRLAGFFARGFGMSATAMSNGDWRCHAPQRELLITSGGPNGTAYSAFAFADEDALSRYRRTLAQHSVELGPNLSPHFAASAFSTRDPDGSVALFGVRPAEPGSPNDKLPARLQHVVFRTTRLDEMVEFYERRLGFVVSDRVRDEAGALRACFLRTDAEHHSLGIFLSPETRLDHHSYETRDWNCIRDWADHVATRRIPLVWGVGRHGPGNNLFFMVKDPDDNLVELSAELEVCGEDRSEGLWPHDQHTLNLWGDAIMRS